MSSSPKADGAMRGHLDWDRNEALRGLLCAMPGALVAASWDVALGCALALGTLIVALVGVPPRAAGRARVLLAGLAFAAAYAIGALVIGIPLVAVVGLAAVGFAGVVAAARGGPGRVVGSLAPPALALGMNHPAPEGLLIAATFVVGSGWATLVALLWPERLPIAATAHPPTGPALDTRTYAVCFALAGTIGLAIGLGLDLVHVAWAAGAALLIMRPVPGLTASRAIERIAATFVGITVAAVIAAFGPSAVVIALVTALAIAAVVGTRGSDWYVSSAGTGLIVLLMSSLSGAGTLTVTYQERLLETAIGAGLALLFGVVLPALLARSLPSRTFDMP